MASLAGHSDNFGHVLDMSNRVQGLESGRTWTFPYRGCPCPVRQDCGSGDCECVIDVATNSLAPLHLSEFSNNED
jgi:hypothetical protein